MKSINILHIKSFSRKDGDRFNFGERRVIPRYEFELICELEICHPEHGKQGSINLKFISHEYDEADGLRNCLQSLLNKEFSTIDFKINNTRFEHCDVDHNNIHAVNFESWEEPYYSLFQQVFTAANWKVQHEIENAH